MFTNTPKDNARAFKGLLESDPVTASTTVVRVNNAVVYVSSVHQRSLDKALELAESLQARYVFFKGGDGLTLTFQK